MVTPQAQWLEVTRLERGLTFLATTSSTAPFIGLFGTVWGIMTAFANIGSQGSTDLAVVAPGIAEALIATALGLFAAILRAVNGISNTNIISTPTIVTLDNQEAQIKVATEVPFVWMSRTTTGTVPGHLRKVTSRRSTARTRRSRDYRATGCLGRFQILCSTKSRIEICSSDTRTIRRTLASVPTE